MEIIRKYSADIFWWSRGKAVDLRPKRYCDIKEAYNYAR